MQKSFYKNLSKRDRTDREVIDYIENLIGRESNVSIPNGFAKSFVGVETKEDPKTEEITYHAVYSMELMIQDLMIEDKMDYDEAVEFLDFNTWNAYPPEGSHPIYINTID